MTERTWTLPERRKPLTRKQFVELFMRQDGRCPNCTQKLQSKGGQEVEIIDEHVNPLWKDGTNELSNRELWCKPCSKPKTAREAGERSKVYSARDKHIGALKSRSPMSCGRNSRWKKKMSGEVVPR